MPFHCTQVPLSVERQTTSSSFFSARTLSPAGQSGNRSAVRSETSLNFHSYSNTHPVLRKLKFISFFITEIANSLLCIFQLFRCIARSTLYHIKIMACYVTFLFKILKKFFKFSYFAFFISQILIYLV